MMSTRFYTPLFIVLALLHTSAVAQTCDQDAQRVLTPASYSICEGGELVKDNLTGLMWSRCSVGQTWNNASNTCEGEPDTFTWQESLQQVQQQNQDKALNKTDWRLPNIKELSSIVNLGCISPAIDLEAFPGTNNGEYWSSTVYVRYAGRAWFVDFDLGNDYASNKHFYKQLRLVRSGKGMSSYNRQTENTSGHDDECDTFPSLTLNTLVDVPLETMLSSDQVQVQFKGGEQNMPISIEDGEYEINDSGIWSSEPGSINSGDRVRVRHLSAPDYLSDKRSTLYVGDKSGIFTTTTMADSSATLAPTEAYEDIPIDAEILFDYDSADLTDLAKQNIDGYVEQFRDKFVYIKDIVIIGHTDGIASQAYNQKLSERRAQSVASYLESMEGMPDQNIQAIGRGKLEPIASNETEEGRAKNRRVVLRLEFNNGQSSSTQGDSDSGNSMGNLYQEDQAFEEVTLGSGILFEYKSSNLSTSAKQSIEALVEQYRGRFDEVKEIVVIGHTDGIASQAYNQTLSEQRAQAVADYLEGIEGIPDPNIQAIGRGKLDPVASNESETGRAKNRRVVVRFEF